MDQSNKLCSLRSHYDKLTEEMQSCGLMNKVTSFEFAKLKRQREEIRRLILKIEAGFFPDGVA